MQNFFSQNLLSTVGICIFEKSFINVVKGCWSLFQGVIGCDVCPIFEMEYRYPFFLSHFLPLEQINNWQTETYGRSFQIILDYQFDSSVNFVCKVLGTYSINLERHSHQTDDQPDQDQQIRLESSQQHFLLIIGVKRNLRSGLKLV